MRILPQNKLLSIALIVSALLWAEAALADSTEIQVYRDDITDRGEVNFDFAANLAKNSIKSELKGRSIFQAVGEFSYGVADNFEAGVKLPVFRADGVWHGNGLIGELKYVAPHENRGFYWGAEVEAGYATPFHESTQWGLEMVPILGYRDGAWHATVNPGLSIASNGDDRGILIFEPSAKLSYQCLPRTAVGLEYFSEVGSLHSFLPRDKRNEVAYLSLDTKLGKSTFQFGLGHGLTDVSPKWVGKVIVDVEFD